MACPHVRYGFTLSSVRRSEMCWRAVIMTSVSVSPVYVCLIVCLLHQMVGRGREGRRKRGIWRRKRIRKMKMSKKHRKKKRWSKKRQRKRKMKRKRLKWQIPHGVSISSSHTRIGLYINVLNIFINASVQVRIYIYMILIGAAINLGS